MLGLTLLAAGLGTATSPASARPDRLGGEPVVRTQEGAVRGVDRGDHRTFEGIPYAAPPVGDLRFRPPRPVRAWRGTLDASAPRSQCAQLSNGTGNATTVEEDCLYLNVTTPTSRHPRPGGRPVMVWIHGGSFLTGTGGSYDAAKLATQGDVVVVTINYRLGPLGFLAQSDLTAEAPRLGSGSYALLDQQAALRWVQRNIRAFGGSPDRVTIVGESAGASSVCANVVSPTARDLFDRAIAQSYSCTTDVETLPQAETVGAGVVEEVGCAEAGDVAACLRAVDTQTLLEAWPGGRMVAGGAALPQQARAAFVDGTANRVDLIHGNTLDENRLFVPLDYGTSLTAEQYVAILTRTFAAAAPTVLDRYPVAAYPSPIIALSTVFSDANSPLSTCEHVDAYQVTDRVRGTRVYAYQFQDRTADPLIELLGDQNGAAHATELPFLFPGLFGDGLSAEQESLSDAMVEYWTNFATYGVPFGRGLPRWPEYRSPRDVLALDIGSAGGIRREDVAAASNCAFWASLAP
ncbi:carboxylesterase/lipase family protein [Nocardioides sambongensis]|uniref:carboxylesterase/lipase family protein n=1 Tax=Nocardioides sambongensis TaxID=2589074 RepID=UPI0015E86C86|nr:carboxylesterase family protein [Nocardioides sambongensis]